MIMNNVYNWAALGCILQLPLWVPILRRELMNRMYSPGNYFLARTISGTIFQMAYPTILGLIIFWLLGIHITAANFFLFLLNSWGIVLCGCGLGYMIGSMFDFPQAANMFLSLVLQYTYLVSGGFANPNTMIGFNRILSYGSACRYSNEIFFRIFSDNLNDTTGKTESIADKQGYNIGMWKSFVCLYSIGIIYVILGYLVVLFKNRPTK